MPFFGRKFCLLSLGFLASPLWAQNAGGAPITAPRTVVGAVGTDVQNRINEGRDLLAQDDPRALTALREAAQIAFKSLSTATGEDVLNAAPASLPEDEVSVALANRALQASYFWGVAADRFARRDEAITALARGNRLILASKNPLPDTRVSQDLSTKLSALTNAGLPLVAPDDVLQTLSLRTKIDERPPLWTTFKWSFDPAPLASQIGGKAIPTRELLITQGKILKGAGADKQLVATPSFYSQIPADRLPPTLQPNQLVLGYTRETGGPNAGQWRLLVRVYYAAPILTQNKRSDRARAEKLARQFLQVHALMQEQLGLSNLYTVGDQNQNVTTLWLLEVSSLWPTDDQDPLVQASLGPFMPQINTGPASKAPTDPTPDPLKTLWQPISGQNESAPGEIIFWRAGLERPEASWLSTMFHEYGHVALPAFGGFRPPLEPYGNGVMGESLGMLWGASLPTQFGIAMQDKTGDSAFLATDFASHIGAYALPAHRTFLQNGPDWRLKNSGSPEALRFLSGASVYLDRVYGPGFLGRALQPLAKRSAEAQNIAARRSLLISSDLFDALPKAAQGGWNGKTWTIWLPGALDMKLDVPTLVNRGSATLQNAQTVSATLFIPSGTESLLITGEGAERLRAVGLPFKNEKGATRIYFAGKDGWQSFGLSAGGAVKVDNARLERR